MLTAIIVIFCVICAVALCSHYMKKRPGAKKNIPGMECRDSEQGNLQDVSDHGSLHEFLMVLHKKYGHVASFWWGKIYVVSFSSPASFKQINNVFNRPVELFRHYDRLFAKCCIQYANDEDGKASRVLYDPPFSHHSCSNYYEAIQQLVEEIADKWSSYPDDQHIAVNDKMSCLAVEAIVQALFDADCFRDKDNVKKFVDSYAVCWNELEDSLSKGVAEEGSERDVKFNQARAVVFDVINDVVQHKKKNVRESNEANFLETIIEANIPENKLLCESVGYVIAGLHTTGYLSTWAIYYLSTHPEVQERLYEELNDVLGQSPLNPETASELTYLRQVIDESLRCSILGPWAARISDEEITVGEYVVPKNTPVLLALGVASQSETYFPDPEKFDPERFNESNLKTRPSLAFQPFGFAGKRKCPAFRFAYVEIGIILSILIRRFKFALAPGHKEVHRVGGLVTKPSTSINVTISKRQ